MSSDKILDDIIKIIYNKDNGETIKNAIISKTECQPQYSKLLSKTNKTKTNKTQKNNTQTTQTTQSTHNNNTHNNNTHNNNATKKLILSDEFKQKCFTKKKKIKKQPKIIIAENKETDTDTNTDTNTDTDTETEKDKDKDKKKEKRNYSYLVFISSSVVLSFEKEKKENKNNNNNSTKKNIVKKEPKKYINWIALINNNKVYENIIKYSLSKEKGLHNFMIRIYKYEKKNEQVMNDIYSIINDKQKFRKIVKNLKTIKNLERIYTNDFIALNEKTSFFNWS